MIKRISSFFQKNNSLHNIRIKITILISAILAMISGILWQEKYIPFDQDAMFSVTQPILIVFYISSVIVLLVFLWVFRRNRLNMKKKAKEEINLSPKGVKNLKENKLIKTSPASDLEENGIKQSSSLKSVKNVHGKAIVKEATVPAVMPDDKFTAKIIGKKRLISNSENKTTEATSGNNSVQEINQEKIEKAARMSNKYNGEINLNGLIQLMDDVKENQKNNNLEALIKNNEFLDNNKNSQGNSRNMSTETSCIETGFEKLDDQEKTHVDLDKTDFDKMITSMRENISKRLQKDVFSIFKNSKS